MVSSVNFGIDDLGYTAFLIILGGIPIRPAKGRSIAGRCRTNHDATIGGPGRALTAQKDRPSVKQHDIFGPVRVC